MLSAVRLGFSLKDQIVPEQERGPLSILRSETVGAPTHRKTFVLEITESKQNLNILAQMLRSQIGLSPYSATGIGTKRPVEEALMSIGERDAEQKLERLAGEIGQVIRSVDPGRQEELKDLAASLVGEEISAVRPGEQLTRPVTRSMNPLAAGLGLLLLGIGFFFLFPPVGVMLAVAGMIGIVWGLVISWTKKRL